MNLGAAERKGTLGRSWKRYGLAIVLVLAATLIDFLLRYFFRTSVFFLPLAAIMFAAMLGGFGPGVLATGLSVLGLEAIVLEPFGHNSLPVTPKDVARVLIFILAGVLVTWVSASLRTAKRHAELANSRLKKERELRERFVSALSHDLRNPISSAKVGIDLSLKYSEKDVDRKDATLKALHAASEALNRANQMVGDLLDANRIQAGHPMPLDLEWVDLAQVLSQVAHDPNHRHGARFDVKTEVSCSGFWDRSGLIRIIENLAGNAIKYGRQDGRITVSLSAQNEMAVVSVHNWGSPIPKNEMPHLFEMFHQAEHRRGWGVGLFIVKSIAQAHGGSVAVKSSEIDGTTFSVLLPPSVRVVREGNGNRFAEGA